jgi:SAM-dependent methyltransferase
MGTVHQATIDDVRDYWNRRPCNIRHGVAPVGTREYFDQVEARKYRVEPHIPGFADFGRWKGRRVLEVGCGIGTDATNFARAGADLTAVELSEESLALCRRRFDVFGLTARFYQANVEQLSTVVPVEPYDLVYSFGVVHHTPDPRRGIEQIMRYMGPGSELRLMLYAKVSWKNLLVQLQRMQPEAQADCPVVFTYTARGVRQLLRGLDVVSIRKEHIFAWSIPEYVEHRYRKVWYLRWMPHPLFRALERLLGWHLLIVARYPASSGSPAPRPAGAGRRASSSRSS